MSIEFSEDQLTKMSPEERRDFQRLPEMYAKFEGLMKEIENEANSRAGRDSFEEAMAYQYCLQMLAQASVWYGNAILARHHRTGDSKP